MTSVENTAASTDCAAADGNTAGNGSAENPFDNGGSLLAADEAERTQTREGIITGLYAREICVLDDDGRKQVGQLPWIDPMHLVDLGVLDEARWPAEHAEVRWRKQNGKPPMTAFTTANTVATLDELRAAINGLRPAGTYALTTIAAMAEKGHEWAAPVIEWARARNKVARKEKTTPRPYRITATQLIACGVPKKVIRALPSAGVAELGASADLLDQWEIKDRDDANRRARAGDGAALVPPQPVSLADLLAEPDEDVVYRIGELWPAAGRVLLAAQFKSGKTTLVGNVIRALVDGGLFLGQFATTPVRRVVLIDTEMDRRTLRRWLRHQGITNTAAVSVLSLRGAVSAFDILEAATRTEWAARLAGADVVILDCLRPVLDALGLSEDKDAGKVLVAFDALLKASGADEGMVVTHMGHANERARGDSRLLDWADALWKIIRGGDETDDDAERPRYFSALGRDVALPEGLLTHDAAARRLTYAAGNRADAGARAALPELVAMVAAEPGQLSKRAAEAQLRTDHGVTQQDARAAIRHATRPGGELVTTLGPHRSQLLSPAPDLSVDYPQPVNGDGSVR